MYSLFLDPKYWDSNLMKKTYKNKNEDDLKQNDKK